mmetsp:Transcript_49558/g.79970  ORF Transcript_49558/g.79970 Transcript_49558/m.79970 type:complete len:207 (-) Transcript_49558:574-1194(-)
MLRGRATQILRTAASVASRATVSVQHGASRNAIAAAPCRWLNQSPVMRDVKDETRVDLMATLDEKPPEKVVKLVEEIVKLNMIETRELIKMLKKELNIPDMPMGMPMGMQMMGGGGAPAAAPAGVAAEAAAPVVEKTEFELKLESFNAPDKLKVIKEVRAITGLGLKESKELVEKSPSIIKAGLTKEDAEKLKKVLEDNGGKVEIV